MLKLPHATCLTDRCSPKRSGSDAVVREGGLVHYRVYKLDPAGRIMSGLWIEADSEPDARAQAEALCDEGSPQVELWQGTRKVAVLPSECRAA